ncbi:hypothetical protein BV898_01698 [Hypsibius exemplaris]|uniref:Uncharacterized protein n=1 Tax=Hypsibius exemplaris TaxID=2072580 RepID=A0A1W0XAT5_HYPEX|nr:hypothetical protein BV898_01698 [Hypsibius exemplaris]
MLHALLLIVATVVLVVVVVVVVVVIIAVLAVWDDTVLVVVTTVCPLAVTTVPMVGATWYEVLGLSVPAVEGSTRYNRRIVRLIQIIPQHRQCFNLFTS